MKTFLALDRAATVIGVRKSHAQKNFLLLKKGLVPWSEPVSSSLLSKCTEQFACINCMQVTELRYNGSVFLFFTAAELLRVSEGSLSAVQLAYSTSIDPSFVFSSYVFFFLIKFLSRKEHDLLKIRSEFQRVVLCLTPLYSG
jgi:hypothetical protein